MRVHARVRTIEPMRFALFVLALGCSGGAEVDAGELADAGALDLDGGREDDAGRELDAGQLELDAGRDAGREADSGTPVDGGVDAGSCFFCCDLFPQGGCADGEACRYQVEDGMRTGTACEPAGTDGEGDRCETYETGGDSCQAGMFCSGICRRLCQNDDDCPELVPGVERECYSGGLSGPYCQNAT